MTRAVGRVAAPIWLPTWSALLMMSLQIRVVREACLFDTASVERAPSRGDEAGTSWSGLQVVPDVSVSPSARSCEGGGTAIKLEGSHLGCHGTRDIVSSVFLLTTPLVQDHDVRAEKPRTPPEYWRCLQRRRVWATTARGHCANWRTLSQDLAALTSASGRLARSMNAGAGRAVPVAMPAMEPALLSARQVEARCRPRSASPRGGP